MTRCKRRHLMTVANTKPQVIRYVRKDGKVQKYHVTACRRCIELNRKKREG